MPKQSGSSLAISLILLFVLSLLSLASVKTSILSTRIQQNMTKASLNYTDQQSTLDIATSKLITTPTTTTIINSFQIGKLFDSYSDNNWPTQSENPGHDKNNSYIIEYLGCYPDTANCTKNNHTQALHHYKITSRTIVSPHTRIYDHKLVRLNFPPQS